MLLFHILLHVGIVFAACAADPNQRSSIGVNKIGVQRKGKNLAAGDIRPGVALENTAYEGGSGPTNTIKGGQGPSDGAPQGGETGVQQSSNDITQAGQGGSQGQGGLKQAAQVQGDQGQAQGGAQSSFTSPSPASTSSLPPSQSSQAPTSGGESSGNTGGGFKASFTGYDGCNTATVACGFYNNPGYNAAVSQSLFGVGSGAGAGPVCGLCYKLTPNNGNSIVVKVNNLCPVENNPLCAYPKDVDVNFDLCRDDGAAAALFGSGPGQINGTAAEVDCGQWKGGADLH